MNIDPQTDHDWTIRAINIQGTFFERLCKKIIAEAQGWKVRSTNHPVEYPPPNGPWRGKESKLDILAECRTEDIKLTLLVECKKNNPELIDWIFFPALDRVLHSSFAFPSVTMIENIPNPDPSKGWSTQASIGSLTPGFKATDDAVETRGSYLEYIKKGKDLNKLTKTAKNSIEDAAYQVALATRSIILEEDAHSRALRDHMVRQQSDIQKGPPFKRQIFLPIVVTTAKLFLCSFDPTDVDTATGELPFEKAQIDPYPYVLYRYALPRSLQPDPGDLANALLNDGLELFRRMDILVINSSILSTILSTFETKVSTSQLF